MPGLTRQCKAGESFQVGQATIRIVKTGRKATVNIVAPPSVAIEHYDGERLSRDLSGGQRPQTPSLVGPRL